MKKYILLSVFGFFISSSIANAAVLDPDSLCPTPETTLTECSDGTSLVDIVNDQNCTVKQCLTFDEILNQGLSMLDVPEEFEESDFSVAQDKLDASSTLLQAFNNEISDRRDSIAELKQTAAQIESDPEAYQELLNNILSEINAEEVQKNTYKAELQRIDSAILLNISEIDDLLQDQPKEVQNVFKDLLDKYKDPSSVVLKNNSFNLKKLQVSTLSVGGEINTTSLFEDASAPDSQGADLFGINNDFDTSIETIEGRILLIDSDILKAGTVIKNAREDITEIDNQIEALSQAEKFDNLQKSDGVISATGGSTNKIENVETVIKNYENRNPSDLTDKERQNLQELKEYKNLYESKDDFQDYIGLSEEDRTAVKTSLDLGKGAREKALGDIQKEQNTIIESYKKDKKTAESEILEVKTEQSEWKAKTTSGEESQKHYDTHANFLDQQARSATSNEAKATLRSQAIDSRLAALDEVDPTGDDPIVNSKREWLNAQKTLVDTGAELDGVYEQIQTKADDIAVLEKDKKEFEEKLSESESIIDQKKKELAEAQGKEDIDDSEIAELKAAIATEEGKQEVLAESLEATNEKIEAEEAEIEDLKAQQNELEEKQLAARKTLSKQDCVYQDATGNNIYSDGYCVQLETAIGETQSIHGGTGLDLLRNYIGILYRYFASIIGILAVLVIVVSGVQMSMAGFNSEFSSQAKTRIFQAIASLVLLFLISLILRTVNPIFFQGGGNTTSYVETQFKV